MDIQIKKLCPELAQDYVCFFDETPHDENIPEHKCYCVCWISADSNHYDCSTVEKRRIAADFMGPTSMYESLGFVRCGKTDSKWIMRKTL